MAVQSYQIVGHRLCPYVQRVVITMLEKNITFDRTDIDLDDKPDWIYSISPNGQVPVVQVGHEDWLFESGVIAAYLDGISGGGLLPGDPLTRARHEAWMSYADGMLNIVARIIYRDADAGAVQDSMTDLAERLKVVHARFPPRGYFAGPEFGLVDAVFATLFRYFSVLEMASKVRLEAELPNALIEWWDKVRGRPSISAAVPQNYNFELKRFIAAKKSHAGRVLALY
jgi:glutathione S-transferase